jgi:hypothetical protein
MQPYEHAQRAWWLLAIPALMFVVVVWVVTAGSGTAGWFMGALTLLVVAIGADFCSLTICVDSSGVRWYFGFGQPSGHLRFDEIAGVSISRTNLLEGWGLHYTIWHGWLWNVWGFQAVELTRSGGGRVTLGTDDPQGLRNAIERFRTGAA